MNVARHTLAALTVASTLALAGEAARADKLLWLCPERVPQQPFRVGLVALDDKGTARAPTGAPTAAGGALEELARQGPVRSFTVRPAGPVVRLEAREGALLASAQVGVGPPAARVQLTAVPAAPVKNQDVSARLEIAVLRGDGTPDPDAALPVLRANVGTIEELKALGGGRFVALYRLPKERWPEVASVVAFAPWPHADASEGAFGALPIPLSSAVSLPGKSEPNVQMSVEIAGKTFGPVTTDDKGVFELPVVVPPGHRFGTSIAVDRLGNRRTKKIDLRLPPTDQLACVANPPGVPADGKARVICLATDPFGAPVAGAKIAARARFGRLEGPRPRSDAYEWEYTAPSRPGAEADELSFEYAAGGPQSKEKMSIAFRPLSLASVHLEVAPQPAFIGGSAVATLTSSDREGRPVFSRAEIAAQRGKLSLFAVAGPGRTEAKYAPPADVGDGWKQGDRISGKVLSALGEVPARLRVSQDRARLVVRAEDFASEPIEGLVVELGKARATTGRDGLAFFELPAASEPMEPLSVRVVQRPSVRADAWRLRTAEAARIFPDDGPFEPLFVATTVSLAPPAEVDVQVEIVPGELRATVIDVATGKLVKGRRLTFAGKKADGTTIRLGAPREATDGTLVIPFAETVKGEVSAQVSDVATGIGTSAEAVLK